MKHIIDLNDFSLKEIDAIINKAFEIKKNPTRFLNTMNGKVLANLFFEPSTRTQFSFQAAMFKLGGQTLGFSNSLNTSVSKGESFKDTIKVVSSYADVLVVRHFQEGAAFCASLFSSCPVINAGDGAHLHPTQTLIDIFTILEYKKRLNNLKIGICGDLVFSRTVNSFLQFLTRHKNNEFVLISSSQFKLPDRLKDLIVQSGNSFLEFDSLKEGIKNLDVLYMNRIQKERIKKEDSLKEEVIFLDEETLNFAKKDLILLHPLPRTEEISVGVDKDKRALYFKQALNGVYVRMAIILEIFSLKASEEDGALKCDDKFCSNENCITNFEQHLPNMFVNDGEKLCCRYCGFGSVN